MAGMFILMIVVSLLISPGWYLELLLPDKIIGLSYTLSESGVAQVTRYTTTLMDWLATYRIVGVAAYTIYVVAVFRGMLFTIKAIYNSCSVVRLMALALLVNFALTPYALFYDYSPLVLTLFFVNFEFAEEPSLVWVQRAGNILVVSSLIVGNNIAYRYWIVVVLVCSLMIKNLYVAYKNITPNLKIS
jgi:hypothetical protein